MLSALSILRPMTGVGSNQAVNTAIRPQTLIGVMKGSDVKALVYRGPGTKVVEDRSKPELQSSGDAIVRITRTTICGTDLHILKGDVATCAPGRILGHEGVGVIDSVGAGVTYRKWIRDGGE